MEPLTYLSITVGTGSFNYETALGCPLMQPDSRRI